MSSFDESNPPTQRHKRCGTRAVSDSIIMHARAGSDKAVVINYIAQLVAYGYAQWRLRGSGDIELRLSTGETFLLAETEVVRIA